MVILVRCRNDVYSIALQSRVDELVREGLISAYLLNGEWVTTEHPLVRRECSVARTSQGKVAALVSSF